MFKSINDSDNSRKLSNTVTLTVTVSWSVSSALVLEINTTRGVHNKLNGFFIGRVQTPLLMQC